MAVFICLMGMLSIMASEHIISMRLSLEESPCNLSWGNAIEYRTKSVSGKNNLDYSKL